MSIFFNVTWENLNDLTDVSIRLSIENSTDSEEMPLCSAPLLQYKCRGSMNQPAQI